MIRRTVERRLRAVARTSPVVMVTGPRQSGKTTVCRAVFRGKPYVTLEAPDTREHAQLDPRGFLAEYPDGAIFDEVQRVPDLLSYLQGVVDEDPRPGRFVLTGSQNVAMLRSVSQSLAGRTSLTTLLPLAREEVERFPRPPATLVEALFWGGYPAIHDRRHAPSEWLADYVATYLERDVRSILGVSDLAAFQRFVRLAAGRSGQILNFSALAADAGITHNTASAWLSVLEASYLVVRVQSWARNPNQRVVKAPKLCFLDSGLLAWLLGIRDPEHIRHHPLRGAIFESWVMSEILKARANRGRPLEAFHVRDRHGGEVDALVEADDSIMLVEAKSGETVASDFFAGFVRIAPIVQPVLLNRPLRCLVVYGGAAGQRRKDARVVPWKDIASMDWVKGEA